METMSRTRERDMPSTEMLMEKHMLDSMPKVKEMGKASIPTTVELSMRVAGRMIRR